MKFDTVSVIGLGYIGLPTAAVLAARKQKVIGIDTNPEVAKTISRGEIHIEEPDLDMVVHAAVVEGWLSASTVPEPADVFLISVPTPFAEDHQPDLSHIEAASRSIAPILKENDLVILESTVPVGATERMAGWLQEMRPDLTFPQTAGAESDIRIAHCPERVLPGRILHELIHNDRVIGGLTPRCAEAAAAFYKTFVEGACIVTDVRTAEMCKLTENSFRDLNIAFANELSIICEKMGIDVWELIRLANLHPRVDILRPGPGVGGHCIAVDPWFIVSEWPEESRLLKTARQVNDDKPMWVLDRIWRAVDRLGRTDEPVAVTLLGLAYKPNVGDLRESPAYRIARKLVDRRLKLTVVEPHIDELPADLREGVTLVQDLREAVERAEIVVILVNHDSFGSLSRDLLSNRTVIDTTGLLRESEGTNA